MFQTINWETFLNKTKRFKDKEKFSALIQETNHKKKKKNHFNNRLIDNNGHSKEIE